MSDTDNKIDFKCNKCVYQLKSDIFVNLCSKKDQPYGIECQSKDFIGFKQELTAEQKAMVIRLCEMVVNETEMNYPKDLLNQLNNETYVKQQYLLAKQLKEELQ